MTKDFSIFRCKLFFQTIGFYTFFILLSFTVSGEISSPAKKGVLDLTSWDVQEDATVMLDGEWEFYWNKLLFADSIDAYKSEARYVKFPSMWQKDSAYAAQGYATYHLKVFLAKRERELALKIPDYYSAYNLYLNGRLIAKNGIVGTSKESSQPHWLPMTIDIIDQSDTLDFVLQISNFRHSKGGAAIAMVLGDRGRLNQLRRQEEGFDLILTGSLIMAGLFFLGLYWFGRHEKPILFFSLYCLTYSYRVFGFGIYTFHSLYPGIPWSITLHLEYLSLFISSLFFACYTYTLYLEETSKYFLKIAVPVTTVFMLATLILPPAFFTKLVDPFFVVLSLSFMYMFYTYVLAAFNKREGSILSLMSTGVLLAVFSYKILIYYGVAPEYKVITFFGYLSFFFLQTLILSFRFTRKLQRAKEVAERASNAKTDFLSMISHEIRTPLNAVIGLTNYLISDKPKQSQVDDLRTLKFSAENLYVLINDVLDYSKLDAGKLEFESSNVNVYELSENILKAQESRAREKGIKLSFDFENTIPRSIICDGLRLSQILTNLVSNAVKFTEEGSVNLKLERVVGGTRKVSIKFVVEDTGIGVPKEKQEVIFDSFSQASTSTTREYGGTGLGLSITKKLLDIQNVDLHLFSTVGVGSKFYFTQTFKVSESQERESSPEQGQQLELKDRRILLVEDNAVNVLVAQKFLARWHLKVDVAGNGREALDKVNSASYDLILMDLQMPIMDGYTASIELRKLGVEIPIIALTASAMLDIGDRVYACGMNDFVTKPFHPNDLYEKIRHHMRISTV